MTNEESASRGLALSRAHFKQDEFKGEIYHKTGKIKHDISNLDKRVLFSLGQVKSHFFTWTTEGCFLSPWSSKGWQSPLIMTYLAERGVY